MYETAIIPLIKASIETIYMVFVSSFISVLLGLVLGAILFITTEKNTYRHRFIGKSLSLLVNTIRSLPFIILMILIIPLTRLLVGTTIGTNAAIVPLTIAAIPFFARICESAFAEVPRGLIDAASAMGASTWQIVTKVLLPESLPTLIRGTTLTIIALIGYSAMAGVVGGGGLGELAINYGYQRFDLAVMLETVFILLIMVEFIQFVGDKLAKQRSIKLVLITSLFLFFFALLYQVWPAVNQNKETLRVGVMSGWSEEVMKVAARVAQEKYGLNLQIIPFSDYVQPNTALNNHSIDANIFQHLPYLQAQKAIYHYPLIPIGKTFVYPMGFYSKRITHISQLKEGAIVAIPNDPSNGARALLLLKKFDLIELKSGIDTLATINDITVNNDHLRFKLLDAAQLPRSLKDVDLVAITNDFITPAGLTIQQALLKEESDSPYANLIVVRKQDKNNLLLKKLVEVMHSAPVKEETEKIFPNGAAIPAW